MTFEGLGLCHFIVRDVSNLLVYDAFTVRITASVEAH